MRANVGEIYSRESGSGTAYLQDHLRDEPGTRCADRHQPRCRQGGLSGTPTPTFNVTMTDPDGNAINQLNWQIDDNADFSSLIQDVDRRVGRGASGSRSSPSSMLP